MQTDPQVPVRRGPFLRLWALIIGANASICLLFFLVSRVFESDHLPAKSVNNTMLSSNNNRQEAPGDAKLDQKFVGPGYFQARPWSSEGAVGARPDSITLEAAKSQVDRIMKERGMGPKGAVKLSSLIEQLIEPAGGSPVDLLQLNLALDENQSRLQE